MNEILLAFMKHAAIYYRRDDKSPTSEIAEFKSSITLVRELYGLTTATEFCPLSLGGKTRTATVRRKQGSTCTSSSQ